MKPLPLVSGLYAIGGLLFYISTDDWICDTFKQTTPNVSNHVL